MNNFRFNDRFLILVTKWQNDIIWYNYEFNIFIINRILKKTKEVKRKKKKKKKKNKK